MYIYIDFGKDSIINKISSSRIVVAKLKETTYIYIPFRRYLCFPKRKFRAITIFYPKLFYFDKRILLDLAQN